MDRMTKRITGAEARALLEGTAPGPWVLSYDDRYNAVCVDDRDGCEILYDEGPIEPHHKLFAAAPDLAARVITLEAEIAEARAEAERRAQLLAEVSADQAALAMGVWSAVHDDDDGTPSLDTPRDRAEVIAAVESLRAERDHARAMVEHMRRLCERRAEERHKQEARAIRAERERHEAAAARDEAVFAREADAAQHRQDLLAIANALGCIDADPASLVAAARIAAHARTGGAP